jgi:hypothetical protein
MRDSLGLKRPLTGCRMPTKLPWRPTLFLSAVVISGACAKQDPQRQCGGLVNDSTAAAELVLDSLSKLLPFPSAVYRYSRDATGFRIVTVPAPGTHVTDGRAIVQLTGQCRISSLVLTDSA